MSETLRRYCGGRKVYPIDKPRRVALPELNSALLCTRYRWASGRTPPHSPRHIAAKPQLALKEDDVAAKNRISTAGERRKNVSVGVGGCRRRNNRAYTESQISLLPISRNPCEKQHAYRRNQM